MLDNLMNLWPLYLGFRLQSSLPSAQRRSDSSVSGSAGSDRSTGETPFDAPRCLNPLSAPLH